MNLRIKLMLMYGSLTIVLLSMVTVGMFLATKRQIRQNTDANLLEISNIISDALISDKNIDLYKLHVPEDLSVRILSSDGEIYSMSGVQKYFSDIDVKNGLHINEKFHYYVKHLQNKYVLLIGKNTAESTDFLKTLLKIMIPIWGLFGVVSMGMGYMLVDRALKPIDQVTRKAAEISATGAYQQRVARVAGQDEMARLVHTFNHMLDHVQETIEREQNFSRLAAHELRTPLTTLQGRLGLALAKDRDASSYRLQLQEMQTGVERLIQLTEGLLQLSRADSVQLEPLELSALVRHILAELAPQIADKGHTVHIETTTTWVLAEKMALEQAVLNLLDNALKYGSQQGIISVQVHPQQLVIQDAGTGPNPQDWLRLLRPLERGTHTVQGSGLGLAFVQAVVQRWQARLVPQWHHKKGVQTGFSVSIHFQAAPQKTA